tara:strand:+ start:205 stop:435 length:231 start_codon:yes stop_codon:yes gene_type:complete
LSIKFQIALAVCLFLGSWIYVVQSEVTQIGKDVAVNEYARIEIKEILEGHTKQLDIIRGSQYEILKQINELKLKGE